MQTSRASYDCSVYGRDPDVGKREKLDAALDDYWGKEDAMEDAAAK